VKQGADSQKSFVTSFSANLCFFQFNVITKDLKKLGYDTSPRNELPFGGIGASGIATGFDIGQQPPSQQQQQHSTGKYVSLSKTLH
jgi:hypothetical protein